MMVFIQQNAFENVVCSMAAILSKLQCVKTLNASLTLHKLFNKILYPFLGLII